MEEYKVISYNPSTREHYLKGEKDSFTVDLFVDSSFDESPELDKIEDIREYESSLVGKTLLVERFFPLVFAARNVKIKK